jgi:hypothetical protein
VMNHFAEKYLVIFLAFSTTLASTYLAIKILIDYYQTTKISWIYHPNKILIRLTVWSVNWTNLQHILSNKGQNSLHSWNKILDNSLYWHLKLSMTKEIQ